MSQKKFVRYAKKIFQSQPEFRVDFGTNRHFSPDIFHLFLDQIKGEISADRLRMQTVGKSVEGRPINLITLGRGSVPVLLWSQMHGDESTATAAIADILRYFCLRSEGEEAGTLLSFFTLHFLPMVNPDGAARTQRRNAQNIDINRDGLALQTPEGKLLKEMQNTLKPLFGFNLHDQELSTTGTSRELTAVALLAPAFDEKKSDNNVRRKAKQLVAAFTESVKPFAKGNIAKYDDAFEPRAFGDSFQKWGTSTILVESGHAMGDPQKESIRRINAAGILSALYAIATGEYLQMPMDAYESLPFNSKKAYEIIIRNVEVHTKTGENLIMDLGLSSQVDTHSEPPIKLVDIGDLSTFTCLEEVDVKRMRVDQQDLRIGEPVGRSIQELL